MATTTATAQEGTSSLSWRGTLGRLSDAEDEIEVLSEPLATVVRVGPSEDAFGQPTPPPPSPPSPPRFLGHSVSMQSMSARPKVTKWPSTMHTNDSFTDTDAEATGEDSDQFFGHSLLDKTHRSMRRLTLQFRNTVVEDRYRNLTVAKYSARLRARSFAVIAMCLVIVVPVLQLAVSQPTLPIGTIFACACAMFCSVITPVALTLVPSHQLARAWNVFLFCTSTLHLAPVFVVLAVCVREDVAPTMLDCVPTLPGLAPLLPLLMGLLSPYLITTFSQGSWYIAAAVSATLWLVATVTFAVAQELKYSVVLVTVMYFLNIAVVSILSYSSERSERAVLWLGIVNKQGSAALVKTEGARADQARRNRTFLSFAAASGQVLYTVGQNGNFATVSTAAQTVLGFPPGDLIGQPHELWIHPDDLPSVRTAVSALWRRPTTTNSVGAPLALQFRRQRPDGTHRWVEMLAVVELDVHGNILVASERDVTQERAVREELVLDHQRRVAASAAHSAHEETLGYACHELRNPLHVINAAMDFLQESVGRTLTPTDQEHMNAIKVSVKQMRTLVDDILDVERLRAGKLSIREIVFSPATLVQEVAMQHSDFARVPIMQDVAMDVPHIVLAPMERIQQVLSNGLTNAAKFCTSGVIRVRVLCGSAPSTLRFEVRNTGVAPTIPLLRGIGFSDHISPSSDGAKGSGLGLRIAASLTSAMGGELHFENLPCIEQIEGYHAATEATFWFEIPFKSQVSSPLRREDSSTLVNDQQLLGVRVLYVDDERLNRRIAENMLKKLGCVFELLEDGDQVMAAQPESFDVIMLDIVMRRMRGDQAVKLIRAAGIGAPCIAVTGNTDAVSSASYLEVGFDAVLGKPFSLFDLRAKLIDARRRTSVLPMPGAIENY